MPLNSRSGSWVNLTYQPQIFITTIENRLQIAESFERKSWLMEYIVQNEEVDNKQIKLSFINMSDGINHS